MTDKIEVRYKEITYEDMPSPIYHKYIVYTKDVGTPNAVEYYARGGPATGVLVPLPIVGFGYVDTKYGIYEEDTIDFDSNKNDPREVILTGDDLSTQWESIKDTMDAIAGGLFQYEPTGQNSNAVADWALVQAGLSPAYFDNTFLSPGSNTPFTVLYDALVKYRVPPEWVKDVSDSFQNGEATGSPLVIDMDGDGIELSALNGAGSAYFDIDNDGFAEASGWVKGGDALLVTDRNNNGKIDNQSELFGNDATYANGFTNLKTFDSNNDGKITSADKDFAKLKVWIDANQDGISQANELYSLAAKKITAINLNYSDVNYQLEGNAVKQESTVTINGQTRKIADVWFSYDNVNTEYAGDYELDARVLFLPTLRGYGKIPDLHIAMSQDETLLNMMKTIASAPANQILSPSFNLEGKISDLLFRWAHVDGISNVGRRSFDAQKLGFLEAFLGETFRDTINSEVNVRAAYPLQDAWSNAIESITVRILAQTGHLKSLFTGTYEYNPISDTLTGAFAPNITGLTASKPVYTGDQESYVMTWKFTLEVMHNLTDLTTLSAAQKNSINALIVQSALPGINFESLFNVITAGAALVSPDEAANTLLKNYGHDVVYAGGGNDIVFGFEGDDYVSGGLGNDKLYGGAGNDIINGDDGDDIISGGAGDNQLAGGAGNDTYVYSSGLDIINDAGGTDTIKFASNITSANITLQRDTNIYDLHILLNGRPGIVIQNHFYGEYGIEKIVFSNGTSIDLTKFKSEPGYR